MEERRKGDCFFVKQNSTYVNKCWLHLWVGWLNEDGWAVPHVFPALALSSSRVSASPETRNLASCYISMGHGGQAYFTVLVCGLEELRFIAM